MSFILDSARDVNGRLVLNVIKQVTCLIRSGQVGDGNSYKEKKKRVGALKDQPTSALDTREFTFRAKLTFFNGEKEEATENR